MMFFVRCDFLALLRKGNGNCGRDLRHAEWGLTVILRETDVRFTPESGHWLSVSGCPLCAKSRLMLAVSLYKIANDIRLMSCGPARWGRMENRD